MKIAIVHDCLTVLGGAEKVLEQMLKLYPEADLFSVIDFFPSKQRHHLDNKYAQTTFIQKLPFSKTKYRYYLPLMPFAIELLDLGNYNLILSSSYAVAKGILTGPGQCHLCYCHTPLRGAWDMQHQYLQDTHFSRGFKGMLAKWFLHKMRLWDAYTAHRVDAFAANSAFIAQRIYKAYRRKATCIPPPVSLQELSLKEKKEPFYLSVSRLVPYKKIDLIIEAFSQMPEKKLFIIGQGPESKKIQKRLSPNIHFLGYQSRAVVVDYLRRAQAFIFAAKEDFGITAIEAQACGTPVIAYGEGGVKESIRDLRDPEPTGLLFPEQTAKSLMEAVHFFEKNKGKISPRVCSKNAQRFSEQCFSKAFSHFVETQWNLFLKETSFERNDLSRR